MLGVDTGSGKYVQSYDLARRAARDLPAGSVGGNDKDSNMTSFIIPSAAKSGTNPIPAHMLTGNKLKVDVKAGSVITYDMVQEPEHSVLWELRKRQEEILHK